MNKVILIFILLLFGFYSKATHIVGGDIGYKHISGDLYQIYVNLYVDCKNGSGIAISDDRFIDFGVFDVNNQFIFGFDLERSLPERVKNFNYTCVIPPENACVDYYRYEGNITIPNSQGGVYVAFQRCCRNGSITNINNPGTVGTTYYTYIPQRTSVINSTPVFKGLPPNFLCVSEPLVYDHSAIDPDGDSLVYGLMTPYEGATQLAPKPSIPDAPPFAKISWRNNHSLLNQLGNNGIFSINSQTGQLNVLPNTIGQYVVGIEVKEYRNGTLINTTYRDFQFNVLPCVFNVNPNFSNSQKCSKTVDFTNTSTGSGITKYVWSFLGENLEDSLERTNTGYTFPSTGNYKVKLTAYTNTCSRSITKDFEIPADTLNFGGPDQVICLGDTTFAGNQNLSDNYRYFWNFDNSIENLSAKYTKVFPSSSRKLQLNLVTISCSISDTIELKINIPRADFTDNYLAPCDDLQAEFNTQSPINQETYWECFDGTSTQKFNGRSVKINFPREGRYIIKQIAREGQCYDTIEKPINIYSKSNFDSSSNYELCPGESRQLRLSGIDIEIPNNISWNYTEGINDSNSLNPIISIVKGFNYVVKKDYLRCHTFDTFRFIQKESPSILSFTRNHDLICPEDTISLFVFGGNTYTWSPSQNLDNPNSANPIARPKESTWYIVRVDSNNGCFGFDSVFVNVYPIYSLNIPEDTVVCLGSPLTFNNFMPNSNYWFEAKNGDTSKTPNAEGIYILNLQGECQFLTDTIELHLFEKEECEVFFPNAFSPNNDRLNDLFPFDNRFREWYPESCSYRNYKLVIFNRWGEIIFTSTNPNFEWDGKYKGDFPQDGVYGWYVSYEVFDYCNFGYRNYYKKGNLTAIR